MPQRKKLLSAALDVIYWVVFILYLGGAYPKDFFHIAIIFSFLALAAGVDLSHLTFIDSFAQLNEVLTGQRSKPRTAGGWITVVASTYLLLSFIFTPLVRHWSYGTWRWDLGAIQQVIWRASQGLDLTSTIILNSPSPLNFVRQQHLELWLYPVALLYRALPHTETLIVIQSLALLGCLIPLWKIARLVLPRAVPPLTVVILFWCCQNLHRINIWDVHENAFIPFFSLWAFYFFLVKKWIHVALFTLAMASFKEDAWVMAGAMAAYFLITEKKYAFALAAATTGFAIFVGYGSLFTVQTMALNARYAYLGDDMHQAAMVVRHRPWIFLEQLFSWPNLSFFRDLFFMGSGLWLAAGWVLVTVAPVFFEIALSTYIPARSLNGHYITPLLGCLFYGVCIGLQKISANPLTRPHLKLVVAVALLLGLWPLEYSETQNIQYMLRTEGFRNRQCYAELLKLLPPQSPVYANDPFSTRVANRPVVLKYDKATPIDYPGAYVIFEDHDPLPVNTRLLGAGCGYKVAQSQ